MAPSSAAAVAIWTPARVCAEVRVTWGEAMVNAEALDTRSTADTANATASIEKRPMLKTALDASENP